MATLFDEETGQEITITPRERRLVSTGQVRSVNDILTLRKGAKPGFLPVLGREALGGLKDIKEAALREDDLIFGTPRRALDVLQGAARTVFSPVRAAGAEIEKRAFPPLLKQAAISQRLPIVPPEAKIPFLAQDPNIAVANLPPEEIAGIMAKGVGLAGELALPGQVKKLGKQLKDAFRGKPPALLTPEQQATRAAAEARAGVVQPEAAKAAKEFRSLTASREAEQAATQLELAKTVRQKRAADLSLRALKAQQIEILPSTVKQAGQKISVDVLSTKEAGQLYKQQFDALRSATKQTVNAKYNAAKDASGVAFERPGLESAIKTLEGESGTLKAFQATKAEKAAREFVAEIEPEGAINSTDIEDNAFNRFKNVFDLQENRGSVPVEIWRETLAGADKPGATVGEMIADRQRIRAAGRAAESAGRMNEARQLGILEKGLTEDIQRASPEINTLIKDADTFYRTEYVPSFVPKAIPFKAAQKPDEAIVQFFFRKAKPGFEKDSIQVAESLLRSVKDPTQISKLGRTLLEGMIDRSFDPLTGAFNKDNFLKEWLSYPNRVREIASGGPKAKAEIDSIISLMRRQKEMAVLVSDLEKGIKGTEVTTKQLSQQIERLSQRPTLPSDLTTAAREVSRTGRTAQVIERQEQRAIEQAAEPKIFTEQAANYMVRWGSLGLAAGAPLGAITETVPVTGTIASFTSLMLAQALVRPSSRKLIKKLMTLPPGSAAVLPVVARLNTILREVEERRAAARPTGGLPEILPQLRRGEI